MSCTILTCRIWSLSASDGWQVFHPKRSTKCLSLSKKLGVILADPANSLVPTNCSSRWCTGMYWREYRYRSLAPIGSTYKISEPTASRQWVARFAVLKIWRYEDTLMQSGRFTLAGKKKVEPSDREWRFLVIDTTETPIDRPKKSRESFTVEKRNATASNLKLWPIKSRKSRAWFWWPAFRRARRQIYVCFKPAICRFQIVWSARVILVIRECTNCSWEVRHPSRSRKREFWQTRRSKATKSNAGSGFALSIRCVVWKCSRFFPIAIEITARGSLCGLTWLQHC